MLLNRKILLVLILFMLCLSLFGERQPPIGLDWVKWDEKEKTAFIYGFQIGVLTCLAVLEREEKLMSDVLGRVSRYEIDPRVLVKIINYYYDLTRGYQQNIEAILYNLEDWLDEETFRRFEEECDDSKSTGSKGSD